jgi:MFS family permease
MRGRGAAALQAGEPFGVGLAALMGLVVAPLLGSLVPNALGGTNAWRLIFLLSSATAAIALLARYALPESAVWDRQREARLSPTAALKLITQRHLWGVLLKGWLLGVFKLGTYWTCYIWLPKFLQTEMHQPVGQSVLWILTTQVGQLLGMVAFGWFADRFGRRQAYTAYSLLTAVAVYPLAFHWQQLLLQPIWFGAALFVLGLGSGCTAGFGALLAELFPTQVRNFAMGTAYNGARMVQFGMPSLVGVLVSAQGLAAGLSVPLVLALATASWVWTLPETRGRDLTRIDA